MSENNSNILNLTIYTVIGDFSKVRETIISEFKEITNDVIENKQGDKYKDFLTLKIQDDSIINFSVNYDSDFMEKHISGMMSYFSKAPCENEKLKKSVINQIAVFNCVIGSNFEQNEDQRRTNYIVNTMLECAKKLNGLLLLPDMRLLNGEGSLVFSIDGNSDLTDYTPTGNADFLESKFEETELDIARRNRTFAILDKKGIPYIEHLRASVTEYEAVLRPVDIIAKRLYAMFAVCVYSESIQNENRKKSLKYVKSVDKILKGKLNDYFTPKEKQFLSNESPDMNYIASFGWRYECCHVLMWALGYSLDLGYPDNIVNVSPMAKILWNQKTLNDFINNSKPKQKTEILDEYDFVMRCHWTAVEARIKQEEANFELNSEVLYEWHYAFNWLISANNNSDWDDIMPNT